MATTVRVIASTYIPPSGPSLTRQTVVPIAFAHIGYKYYYVPLAVNIVSLVIFFLYVKETKGRTLEEMAQVFDGPTVHRSVADKEGGYAQNAARSVEKLEVEHKE